MYIIRWRGMQRYLVSINFASCEYGNADWTLSFKRAKCFETKEEVDKYLWDSRLKRTIGYERHNPWYDSHNLEIVFIHPLNITE